MRSYQLSQGNNFNLWILYLRFYIIFKAFKNNCLKASLYLNKLLIKYVRGQEHIHACILLLFIYNYNKWSFFFYYKLLLFFSYMAFKIIFTCKALRLHNLLSLQTCPSPLAGCLLRLSCKHTAGNKQKSSTTLTFSNLEILNNIQDMF